jgi:hypothetical protein
MALKFIQWHINCSIKQQLILNKPPQAQSFQVLLPLAVVLVQRRQQLAQLSKTDLINNLSIFFSIEHEQKTKIPI